VRKYGDELYIYAMSMQASKTNENVEDEQDDEYVEKRDIKLKRKPIYSGKRFRIQDIW